MIVTPASAIPDCTAVRQCFHASLSAVPCGDPGLQRLDPQMAAVTSFNGWYARRLHPARPKLPPIKEVTRGPKPRLIKTDPSPSFLGSEPHRRAVEANMSSS